MTYSTTFGLLIIALFTALFSMIAERLSRTIITAPMAFLGIGYLMSQTGFIGQTEAASAIHVVAEIALVLLLFLDAAQIDLKALRRQHVWPVRMLILGLPLAVALGTLVAWLVLPSWPLVGLALAAAILAPTDAALGQAVVTNASVPERARRALTVESGLNDGMALPIILLFAGLTAETMGRSNADWIVFAIKQLTLGPIAGAAIGLMGGCLLLFASHRHLTSEKFEGIGAIALAGSAYLFADQIGGNGFIAAFAGGLCFGNIVQGRCKYVYEFTESEGQLLTWAAFALIGLALMPQALSALTTEMLVYILLSLFVVRPAAIWLSLIGTDASPTSRVFFGWFGPRGLATALFALLIVHKIDHGLADPILALAVNAVWISALLHGLSAVPGADWYARRVAAMGTCPESQQIESSAKPLVTKSFDQQKAT